MSTKRDEFLAGERPEDVAIYLAESFVSDLGPLEEYGDRVEDGVLLVVPGDNGRAAFQKATGKDAMGFAREAGGTEAPVDRTLAGGDCPEAGDDGSGNGDHEVKYVFAFAEERNEEVGGIYAEGDVVHAYAQCSCGTAYSDRWVVTD